MGKIAPNGNRVLTDDERKVMISKLEEKYEDILDIFGFDRSNHNIEDTPKRMAKMYVNEIFKGCFTEEPNITVFPNVEKVDQMIMVGPIDVKSTCSHHSLGFTGSAYIGYIPGKYVCGVSKLARIVDWYARRPQIQEELTHQIANYIQEKMEPLGVGIYITAHHTCMGIRGVQQANSMMDTCALKGNFKDGDTKMEFLKLVEMKRK